jgi:hypothetical protein
MALREEEIVPFELHAVDPVDQEKADKPWEAWATAGDES